MPDTPIIPISFNFEGKDFAAIATEMERLFKLAEKFKDAIKSGDEVKKNNDNLKKTTKHMGEIVNLQNKHAIEAKKTGGIVGGLENKVKQLRIAIRSAQNPSDVKKYNTELRKTQKQLTKLKTTTQGWGKALGSFQFKFNALGNIAANVASTITNKVTRSLREAVDTVIDFEKSFAEVLSLLNKSQKADFKNILKQNSVDIMKKYGLTVEDTNKAMFDAISAGVELGDVYGVLDAAARLAVGGVTNLNSATKGIASVMNAFSLEMSEAENVASAFFQAQKFGITFIDEMVASMGRANTIASLAGASYREMLAAFTAITKSGLNTEEAITGLRNVFKELVASSGEAAAELNRLGIATGSNAVQSRGFIGVLDDLNKAYLNNNEVIPKIFGNIRGLTGIMGIVGKRYETFRFILEQVNDAMASQEALNDAVIEQMGTTAKKLDVLSASWNALIISITEGQSEQGSALKSLINGLTDLVQFLTPKFYEDYTQAMEDAKIATKDLTDEIKSSAKSRSSLFDDEDKAQKVFTDNIIRGAKLRIDAAQDEIGKSQKLYTESAQSLQKLRKEFDDLDGVGAFSGNADKALELKIEIQKLEESTDDYNITLLKNKAIHEGLLAFLEEFIKKENEQQKQKDNLSDQERKNLITLIKLRRDIEIAKIKIAQDGVVEEIKIQQAKFAAELKLIELADKKEEEKALMREKAKLQHENRLLEIQRKAARQNIQIDSEFNISRIKLTSAGYEKEVALALENNIRVLQTIANGNHDKEAQQKLEQAQALKHQLALNAIEFKFTKQRLDLRKNIDIAALNLNEETKKNSRAIAERQLQHENDVIELLLDEGVIDWEESLDRKLLALLNYNKAIQSIGKKQGTFGDLLGISRTDQDSLNMMIDSLSEFTDAFIDAADRRIDAIQREIDASAERERSLQADRDHEFARLQEGLANNLDLKEKELAAEKKRGEELRKEEKKALQEKRKAADAQIVIDTLIQASNLVVAATSMFAQETAKAGVVGLAVAAAGIGIMLAAFLGFKANAREAAGFAEGEVDIQGVGTEKSDSINAKISKGESVMTAKATKPNKKNLRFMQNNPNHPLFETMEKHGVDNVFNKLSDQMQNNWVMLNDSPDKWDKMLYNEMRSHNDKVENRPFSFIKGSKVYTIEGNQVTVTDR